MKGGAVEDSAKESWCVFSSWVVSNIFYFHHYLGKSSSLTNIFQMGWFNHHLFFWLWLGTARSLVDEEV